MSALAVTRETHELVWSGLVDLSNTEDEVAEEERRKAKHRRDPDRLRYARAAATGLSNLGTRIARAFL